MHRYIPILVILCSLLNGAESPEALYQQAQAQFKGNNNAEALRLMRASAESGYPRAVGSMAKAYLNGYYKDMGLEKDSTKGLEMLKKAVSLEDAPSQALLGGMYMQGEAVTKDVEEGKKLLLLGAKQGNIMAQYQLAQYYYAEKDTLEAYAWLNVAASSGNKGLVTGLNEMEKNLSHDDLEKGQERSKELLPMENVLRQGFPMSDPQALKNVEEFNASVESATKGNVEEMVKLANRVFNGSGIPKNWKDGVGIYLRAAEAGNVEAIYMLGTAYFNGWGVELNKDMAFKHLQFAVEKGWPMAYGHLALCYINGVGTAVDLNVALKYLKIAKEKKVDGLEELIKALESRIASDKYETKIASLTKDMEKYKSSKYQKGTESTIYNHDQSESKGSSTDAYGYTSSSTSEVKGSKCVSDGVNFWHDESSGWRRRTDYLQNSDGLNRGSVTYKGQIDTTQDALLLQYVTYVSKQGNDVTIHLGPYSVTHFRKVWKGGGGTTTVGKSESVGSLSFTVERDEDLEKLERFFRVRNIIVHEHSDKENLAKELLDYYKKYRQAALKMYIGLLRNEAITHKQLVQTLGEDALPFIVYERVIVETSQSHRILLRFQHYMDTFEY